MIDSLVNLIDVLYTHIINMLIYTYTCWIHTDAMNNDEQSLL